MSQKLSLRHSVLNIFLPLFSRFAPQSRIGAAVAGRPLRQRDRDLLYRASAALAVALRGRFGRRAMGPVAPPVDRIREEYITEFLLKIESGASASRAREVLREVLRQTLGAKEFQTVTLSCDVDPQ